MALLAISLLIGCTEVTQSPSDCVTNEFFDNTLAICRTCPPVEALDCPQGCGFNLEVDERSCPIATCECDLCDAGQFFDEDTLACESCEDSPLTCAQGCSLVAVNADERGCEVAACACEEVCNPRILDESGDCEACPEVSVPQCAPGGLSNGTDGDGCPLVRCLCPSGSFIDDDGACQPCPAQDAPEACEG